jgi:hypothetical protein
VDFYASRDQTRVAHVDVVLERYKGREQDILVVIAAAEKEERAQGSVQQMTQSSSSAVTI